jgi:hypothetical protein
MSVLLVVALAAWGLWVVGNVALWLLSPILMRGSWGAFTNGLVIVVPDTVRALLTPEQLDAVIAHERGHQAHLHAIRNLAMACCFLRRSAERFERQEIEADDYAAARGHAMALATALCRLSTDPFDHERALRLARNAAGHVAG